jgi:hypothetical protein
MGQPCELEYMVGVEEEEEEERLENEVVAEPKRWAVAVVLEELWPFEQQFGPQTLNH